MDDGDWTVVTAKRTKCTMGGGSHPHRDSSFGSAIGPKVIAVRSADASAIASEIGLPRRLTPESRNTIVQKRVALGKNQVQLNLDCRFPVNTIRDIENGRFCPNPQQLSVLNRVLKASLKYQ